MYTSRAKEGDKLKGEMIVDIFVLMNLGNDQEALQLLSNEIMMSTIATIILKIVTWAKKKDQYSCNYLKTE